MYQINVPSSPQPGYIDNLLSGFNGGMNIASKFQDMQNAKSLAAFNAQYRPLELQQAQQQIKNSLLEYTQKQSMGPLEQQLERANIQNVLAHTNYFNNRANAMNQPDNTFSSAGGKAVNDYYKAQKLWGEADQRTQYLKMIAANMAGKGGAQSGPGFSIGTDGTQMNTPNQPAAPGQNVLSQPPSSGNTPAPSLPTLPGPNASSVTAGMPLTVNPADIAGIPGAQSPGQPGGQVGNLVQIPTSAHTAKGNQGATYIDQNTGNSVSVPTSKLISQAQSGILAGRILEPQLKNLFNDISPVLGNNKFFDRLGNRVEQQTGQESPVMDKYDAAINTSIPMMAEQIVKNANVNATTEAVNKFQDTITPKPTETKYQYARRVASGIVALQMKDQQYVNTLRSSLPLQQQRDLAPVMAEMQDNIYHSLIGDSSGTSPDLKQAALAELKNRKRQYE